VQDKIPHGPFRYLCEQAEKIKDWTWPQIGKFALALLILIGAFAAVCFVFGLSAAAGYNGFRAVYNPASQNAPPLPVRKYADTK